MKNNTVCQQKLNDSRNQILFAYSDSVYQLEYFLVLEGKLQERSLIELFFENQKPSIFIDGFFVGAITGSSDFLEDLLRILHYKELVF